MRITSEEAGLALHEIETVSRRVRGSLLYARASRAMIVWGLLTFAGYLLTQFRPLLAPWTWRIIYLLGFAAMVPSGLLRFDDTNGRLVDRRLVFGFGLFIGFGVLVTNVLGSFSPRQLSAFWPVYFMVAYCLVGLWIGPAFTTIGLAITALTVAAFEFSGQQFDLVMAFVNGLGLVFAGMWMRKR